MQKYLFLAPVFKEMIWGGNKLNKEFGYKIPSEKTGEAWVISGHKNGDCLITNGSLKGQTLSQVYMKYKELFGFPKDQVFPLLAKIIDADSDLSIQIHPNDEYARIHSNDLGKTECWYILDAEAGGHIVYGHNAKTKEELIHLIVNKEWDKLLRKQSVKKGDFIFVPSGTVHAICKGLLILEIQQSSDTTYRFYDYDRIDDKGNKRPLHLEDAINVIRIPHVETSFDKIEKFDGNTSVVTLIESPFFSVYKIKIKDEHVIRNDNYSLVNVLEGNGTIEGKHIKKGDSFIITKEAKFSVVKGQVELLISIK